MEKLSIFPANSCASIRLPPKLAAMGQGRKFCKPEKMVNILKINPVGHYAIQPHFSDGHNTGIYSWDLLYNYGSNQDKMWQDYLQRLKEAGASRESKADLLPDTQTCQNDKTCC